LEGDYTLFCPSLVVTKFRPSLLQSKGEKAPSLVKPLIMKEIVVNNLKGPLNDPSKWQASGRLTFQNKAKKRFGNTIFQVPADILSRLGLDLSALNPVSGGIDFKIEEGKVYLTKFKDVVSQGKLSKFYLAKSKSGSYMDFDGNLNVQIRMKQYNLLFKLAELLNVSVKGTITKPTYSLQSKAKKAA
jgi:hypothetical protein